MDSKNLGVLGEKIAEKFLKRKGYQILDKNYTFRIPGSPQKGEIDIIAKKGDTISFIEVKALTKSGREQFSAILPEEKVDYLKQKKIIKTAESWLMEKKISPETKWQVDVISIKLDLNTKKAKIRHFENAAPY